MKVALGKIVGKSKEMLINEGGTSIFGFCFFY